MAKLVYSPDRAASLARNARRSDGVSRFPSIRRSAGSFSNANNASSSIRGIGSSEASQALIVPRDFTPSSFCKSACAEYPLRFRQALRSRPIIWFAFRERCGDGFSLATNLHSISSERLFGSRFASNNPCAELHKFVFDRVQKLYVRFSDTLLIRSHLRLRFFGDYATKSKHMIT